MPMRKNRGKAAPRDSMKSAGGYKPTTKYDERNVNAGGKYVGDAPGLTRDTTPRIIRGPGR